MNLEEMIIMAAPAQYSRDAAALNTPVAHLTYRIGRGFHLYRAYGSSGRQGGLMVIDTSGLRGGGPFAALVAEIIGECSRRSFSGIILDTGGGRGTTQVSLCMALAREARINGLKLFVQPALADVTDSAIVLVQTALSGGTLRHHIETAVKQFGASRVALEIERVHMDFTLPAKAGVGRELTYAEFKRLFEREKPQVFFSNDLCALYFSYRGTDGTHFVLFDDASSIKRKLHLGRSLGIESALMFYPHIRDIAADIIA